MVVHQTPYNAVLDRYQQAPAVTPILDINFGFARARILDTALALGLFTSIARGIHTCPDLATVAECDHKSLQHLLDALVGLELLQRGQDTYSLSTLAATYLVEGQPDYIGSHLLAVLEQWDSWGELTQVVRSGHKHIKDDWGSPAGRGHNPGMFADVFPLVFPVAWQMADQFEQPLQGRVLDMFTGSGAWGIAMALRHPQVEVVARDEAALLDTVRENVHQTGLDERFTFQTTEANELTFAPESFRLIIVAHACRFLGAQKSQALLHSCYRLLQPGGQLLLMDVMSNAERTGPPAALTIQLSLFLNTREGDVFTADQFHSWLKAASFQSIQDLKIGHVPLILASR
jgi:SAM-dependent methyltransferase